LSQLSGSSDPDVSVVILAAGQGTRMKSTLAKVLHPVGGKPMVMRAIETAQRLSQRLPVLVIGHESDAVRATVGERAQFVLQAEQRGTGHAVMQAADALRDQRGMVVVFYADMPLLRAETLQGLIQMKTRNAGPLSLLTVTAADPRGFGRIVRDTDGHVTAIVEEADCTPEQRLIRELNPGVYAFRADWLWQNLSKLTPKGRKHEFYLTDMVQIAVEQGGTVAGLESDDPNEMIGVNTRVHLSDAEAALRKRIANYWMLEGVTIVDPATTYIQEDVTIGQDTVIYPNTHLQGHTHIGAHCVIGPNSVIVDSQIGAHCTVEYSVVEGAVMRDHAEIGPFSHLRKGAYLDEDVHMGNFGEVKNSRLGLGTRMGHFSYIGDAEIGEDVNIGAGTITVNYDGVNKHKTVVGDHAFIGSDTMLIAPVTVEDNGRTAAGAVVTHDVPAGYIAVGVPARLREFNGVKPLDEKEKEKGT